MVVTLSSLLMISVLRVLFKWGYKWNLSTSAMSWKPSLTHEYDNHLCAAKEITISGSSLNLACVYCFNHFILCVMMKSHFKCAECTHWGHSCVGVMWESSNCVHNKLKSEILQVKEEQARLLKEQSCLFTKLSQLCKTLCQTQDCAKQKTLCLLKKMNNNNDDDEETSQPETLSQLFNNMSNDFWQFNLVTSPSQSAEVFLCNHWGFLWVLMCFQRCYTPFTWWDSGLFH